MIEFDIIVYLPSLISHRYICTYALEQWVFRIFYASTSFVLDRQAYANPSRVSYPPHLSSHDWSHSSKAKPWCARSNQSRAVAAGADGVCGGMAGRRTCGEQAWLNVVPHIIVYFHRDTATDPFHPVASGLLASHICRLLLCQNSESMFGRATSNSMF
jgi:hypothetical protein